MDAYRVVRVLGSTHSSAVLVAVRRGDGGGGGGDNDSHGDISGHLVDVDGDSVVLKVIPADEVDCMRVASACYGELAKRGDGGAPWRRGVGGPCISTAGVYPRTAIHEWAVWLRIARATELETTDAVYVRDPTKCSAGDDDGDDGGGGGIVQFHRLFLDADVTGDGDDTAPLAATVDEFVCNADAIIEMECCAGSLADAVGAMLHSHVVGVVGGGAVEAGQHGVGTHEHGQSVATGLPSLRTIRDVAEGVFRGLQQMHAAGVVHMDVKPSNVLRRGRGGRARALRERDQWCLCDFGGAVVVESADVAAAVGIGSNSNVIDQLLAVCVGPTHMFVSGHRTVGDDGVDTDADAALAGGGAWHILDTHERYGTLWYQAPEVLFGALAAGREAAKADMWSAGVVLLVLLRLHVAAAAVCRAALQSSLSVSGASVLSSLQASREHVDSHGSDDDKNDDSAYAALLSPLNGSTALGQRSALLSCFHNESHTMQLCADSDGVYIHRYFDTLASNIGQECAACTLVDDVERDLALVCDTVEGGDDGIASAEHARVLVRVLRGCLRFHPRDRMSACAVLHELYGAADADAHVNA